MTLEETQEIFNNILELCDDSQIPRLIEIASTLYQEIEFATDAADIQRSAEELQVVINEVEYTEEEEEFIIDIQKLLEQIQE